MSHTSQAYDQATSLWLANDLPPEILSHLKLRGCPDTAINSSFKLGSAAQVSKPLPSAWMLIVMSSPFEISIGLSGLATAYIHSLRTGNMQDVSVDARHAILDISRLLFPRFFILSH